MPGLLRGHGLPRRGHAGDERRRADAGDALGGAQGTAGERGGVDFLGDEKWISPGKIQEDLIISEVEDFFWKILGL